MLIETDSFPFEFLSQLAERESWRKEIHRPVYHVHKWWAKRLGSVFRGILLGCVLKDQDLAAAFYKQHDFRNIVVFDPFMGSGTTIGEAHKLGLTAIGRDINPVATEAVSVAFGPLEKPELQKALVYLLDQIGERIQALYKSKDAEGRDCDVLYYFWVMQCNCPACSSTVDLFPSYVIASNAYPQRKPEVQLLCPSCGEVFRAAERHANATCPGCGCSFNPDSAPARGAKATCRRCDTEFVVLDAIKGKRPTFRLYAKLVLAASGTKQYLKTTREDELAYAKCTDILTEELAKGAIELPSLALEHGYNTRQAISYGFRTWRDFFNDRQLLALAWLRKAIADIRDEPTRAAMFVLFSGALEFNNLFTSYKGEGTGAVRHMFAHHILKPERVPIEANVWGTPKSSGSFTGLFRSRLLRAIEYRRAPSEVNGTSSSSLVCAAPFTGRIEEWPNDTNLVARGIYISCGDSANSSLPTGSVDLVVTDPPFFDNVHYSELADFFYAWRGLNTGPISSTRHRAEVQDANVDEFSNKLRAVFSECARVLKDNGLLVFTYHHSRVEGWSALAKAILGADFVVINSHPVKAEMSVATPKAQAKEPIQIDIVLVCKKIGVAEKHSKPNLEQALSAAKTKLARMIGAGFRLSANDRKVILIGQLLCTVRDCDAINDLVALAAKKDDELESVAGAVAA